MIGEPVVREFRSKRPSNPLTSPLRGGPEMDVDETGGNCCVCGYWGVVPAHSEVLEALVSGTEAALVCQDCADELENEEDGEESVGLERVECWRCGYDRLTYESCPECGASCKPLTARQQRESDSEANT